jgi:hypothetical protein
MANDVAEPGQELNEQGYRIRFGLICNGVNKLARKAVKGDFEVIRVVIGVVITTLLL